MILGRELQGLKNDYSVCISKAYLGKTVPGGNAEDVRILNQERLSFVLTLAFLRSLKVSSGRLPLRPPPRYDTEFFWYTVFRGMSGAKFEWPRINHIRFHTRSQKDSKELNS